MEKLELADIFGEYRELLGQLPAQQLKVVNAITNCRTEVLGGHKEKCTKCNYERPLYNSCRNRHCSKCGSLSRTKWIEKRMEDLLPCQYFHVVFTIPSELNPIILRNKSLCYDILFKAASQTLKEVAANPKNLGAEIGFIGVLHTWSQSLLDHPHIHFIVPGGGLSMDKNKWIKCKDNYFLPVKVLSKVFKAKFLEFLKIAKKKHEINFIGNIQPLEIEFNFLNLIDKCYQKDWVVYSKEPFAGPIQVISYLGGYTHRIGISKYRLIKTEANHVHFKCRDRENPKESKVMVLHVVEFMRRFLLHVLPKGYMRIRHFGLLGNRYRKVKIELIRKLNGILMDIEIKLKESWQAQFLRLSNINVQGCPKCKEGELFGTAFTKNQLNSC